MNEVLINKSYTYLSATPSGVFRLVIQRQIHTNIHPDLWIIGVF